jgi:hypothetical protein
MADRLIYGEQGSEEHQTGNCTGFRHMQTGTGARSRCSCSQTAQHFYICSCHTINSALLLHRAPIVQLQLQESTRSTQLQRKHCASTRQLAWPRAPSQACRCVRAPLTCSAWRVLHWELPAVGLGLQVLVVAQVLHASPADDAQVDVGATAQVVVHATARSRSHSKQALAAKSQSHPVDSCVHKIHRS